MFEGQSEKLERAKAGLAKREALLRGELQVEGVRQLMGLKPKSEYPNIDELPDRFFLPAEIIPRVASMTRQQLEKGKERECFVGFLNGKYWLSKVHKGDEEAIRDEHRDFFPKKKPDYVVLEVHTHKAPEGKLPAPSSGDIASFLISFPHLPGVLISSDVAAWVMIKSRQSFEMPVAKNVEERGKAHKELKAFAERSIKNFCSSRIVDLTMNWDSLFAAILERYGAVLYSSSPRMLMVGQTDLNPILDPKQTVEMVRISGETHKKFLAE